jgi:hypothetical protein
MRFTSRRSSPQLPCAKCWSDAGSSNLDVLSEGTAETLEELFIRQGLSLSPGWWCSLNCQELGREPVPPGYRCLNPAAPQRILAPLTEKPEKGSIKQGLFSFKSGGANLIVGLSMPAPPSPILLCFTVKGEYSKGSTYLQAGGADLIIGRWEGGHLRQVIYASAPQPHNAALRFQGPGSYPSCFLWGGSSTVHCRPWSGPQFLQE